jgi:hypothetical protein
MTKDTLNPDDVHRVLIDCAMQRCDISYSEMLAALGLGFTRPKMRQLCRVLGVIDEAGRENGEPELAVLVVRGSDRMPGEGWWESRIHYQGERAGEGARKYVQGLQRKVFKYWSSHVKPFGLNRFCV